MFTPINYMKSKRNLTTYCDAQLIIYTVNEIPSYGQKSSIKYTSNQIYQILFYPVILTQPSITCTDWENIHNLYILRIGIFKLSRTG